MNFNSVSFFIYLPVVVIVYFLLRPSYRNVFLLAASYFFYMSYRPVYGLLILFSTLSTYVFSICLSRGIFHFRKLWLITALLLNLTILFYFKYFNFVFRTSFDIILPIGISFFTFQALGYIIDVYRGDIDAEMSLINYALFVSFFPQLVAGPIERSNNLLPQLKNKNKLTFVNFHEGLTLILWGLFKKIVIADSLAIIVNFAYEALPGDITAAGYIIAAVGFSFQIYCDFSAYSDIARGSAKILGITLMKNFASPYTASSVREFWRRWHISLSAWFKDYLYIPLGGGRKGIYRTCLNILIVFTISGLWHGASFTFIVWGLINGLFQVIELITKRERINLPVIGHITTFMLITAAFIFFRANTLAQAFDIIKTIFTGSKAMYNFACIMDMGLKTAQVWALLGALLILIITDIVSRFAEIAEIISRMVYIKYVCYIFLVLAITVFGIYGTAFNPQAFIYFQF